MTTTHILGYPRIGARRELKFALESFWKGESDEAALRAVGRELRARHWQNQRDAGLDFVTVGDFHWYDQVQGTLALLGALPTRFGFDPAGLSLAQLFAAARGDAGHAASCGCGAPRTDQAGQAMEMTKWFDTNYHYLVPEWTTDIQFDGGLVNGVGGLFEEIEEARALGHAVKPVLLGPVTLLWLGKAKVALADRLNLLPRLVSAYRTLLARLAAAGVEWVQVDEPALVLDLPQNWRQALRDVYAELGWIGPKVLLATYFDEVDAPADFAGLPVAGWHVDLVRAPAQLQAWLATLRDGQVLSCGVIDGRNVWKADLAAAWDLLQVARAHLGERLWIAPSCSLLHVPVDLAQEDKLAAEVLAKLAFARQKLDETVALARALDAGQRPAPRARQEAEQLAFVRERVAALGDADARRPAPYPARAAAQRARFRLPLLPTTTIGSFPQTPAIRAARAAFKRGELGHLAYLEAMRAEIADAIGRQEKLGLDVLVHGEAERNDMVEYFGEQIWGYAFTRFGWVQSYGSRCVKPPVLHGDIHRPEPMTVSWIAYAQSLSDKPVKGMLTGPVTMLQWSFVRDDLPRSEVALQLALALRDEVTDLEKAGIGIIQIDEPAFREGQPLKLRDKDAYFDWAVRAFGVAAGVAAADTQIHTHMCYSDFNDILPAITALDADVITIETARSDMELLEAFGEFAYPNEIGPGVYDIHSPVVVDAATQAARLRLAAQHVPAERLWANPDCGLKTRGWPETEAALANLVAAAQLVRAELTVAVEAAETA